MGAECGKKGHLRGSGLLVADIITRSVVGSRREPASNLEGLLGEVGRLPDSEAAWVSVPLVIRLGHISHVVDLLARIIVVYMYRSIRW